MKLSNRAAILAASLLMLPLAFTPARAEVFDWTMTGTSPGLGGPLPASGTLTVTVTSGEDLVTAITGSIGGVAITGIEATGTLTWQQQLGFSDGDDLFINNRISF